MKKQKLFLLLSCAFVLASCNTQNSSNDSLIDSGTSEESTISETSKESLTDTGTSEESTVSETSEEEIVYSVSITNKEQLTALWRVGDNTREITFDCVNGDKADAVVTSSDANVVEVNGTTLTAKHYGTVTITVTFHDKSDSVEIVVTNALTEVDVDSEPTTYTLKDNLPNYQGENGFYVYESVGGGSTHEGGYAENINTLFTHVANGSKNDGYWDGRVFVGPNHTGGFGLGAFAYEASAKGYYSIYTKTWQNASGGDGWQFGHAKKDLNGTFSLLTYSDVLDTLPGNEENPAGEVKDDFVLLSKGEQIMHFFAAKENGAADERGTRVEIKNQFTAKLTEGVIDATGAYVLPVGIDVSINIVGLGKAVLDVSDPEIINFDGKKLNVNKAGSANILVENQDKTLVIPVKAIDPVNYSGAKSIEGEAQSNTGDSVVLRVGDEKTINVDGAVGLSYSSSCEDVASVDADGKVVAKSSGKAIIHITNGVVESKITIIVKKVKDANNKVISLLTDCPTYQGDGGKYVYHGEDGGISTTATYASRLNGAAQHTGFESGNGWWDGGWSFLTGGNVHPDRLGWIGGSGFTAFGYIAEAAGTYRVDYSAYNANLIGKSAQQCDDWNLTGCCMGIAVRRSSGVEVIERKMISWTDLFSADTNLLFGENEFAVEQGEEIMVYWFSNGSGSNQEDCSMFNIQKIG